MGLHWSVEDVADFEEVCLMTAPADDRMRGVAKGDRVLRPLTHALVMMGMGVGLGGITAKNWREWYARLSFLDRLNGPLLTGDDGGPRRFTPEDVFTHVGLTVNVGRETRAQWLKRIGQALDRAAYHAERWEAQRAVEVVDALVK
jgi:hypothetical protein